MRGFAAVQCIPSRPIFKEESKIINPIEEEKKITEKIKPSIETFNPPKLILEEKPSEKVIENTEIIKRKEFNKKMFEKSPPAKLEKQIEELIEEPIEKEIPIENDVANAGKIIISSPQIEQTKLTKIIRPKKVILEENDIEEKKIISKYIVNEKHTKFTILEADQIEDFNKPAKVPVIVDINKTG